ncbi:MAG TPA: ZIP family metal transporter [Candidatus Thermoplasmatota archaeon]|nr:ZIP family metal transporter [Candidatus Thermoplasmatota archaeon]
MAWGPTLLAVAVVSVVSLVGAATFLLPRLRTHRVLLFLVALAAGTLVGDAFLHLLPEAEAAWDGGSARVGQIAVLGFTLFFLFEVLLRGRHAHVEAADAHAQEHHGSHGHAPPTNGRLAPFAYTNLVGDGLHNFLDGAAIATAFLVDTHLGIATTIAVVLHEVPQELADFGVLLRAGLAPRRALLWNFLSGLLAVAGAVTILLLPLSPEVLERIGLPLILGAFLYIAAADLIPELHHHSRGREAWLIVLAFLLGLTIMGGLVLAEGAMGGDHGHGHAH